MHRNVDRKRRRLPWGAVLAALALLVLGLAAAGCGGQERSTASYCKAYNDGFASLKRQYPDVDQYSHSQNPLMLLLRTTSALGDVVALIGDMADAAPDDIRTDTQRVHDSMQKQIDLIGGTSGSGATGKWSNFAIGIINSMVDSITNAGAYQRMDQYIVDHCGGKHMFSASPQT
jgi:hypothetical protein